MGVGYSFNQITAEPFLCILVTLPFPTATSPRVSSELEQARPQTSGEEELQLQLALAMSREVAEQVMSRLLSWCGVE